MFYLGVDDVLDAYEQAIGPRSALVRPEGLESAVALPQATMFGEELYPHAIQKAAALLRSLAQNQPFIDGNKRIAWLAMRLFLLATGLNVRAATVDALQLMLDLAERRRDCVESHRAFDRKRQDSRGSRERRAFVTGTREA